MPQRVTLTLIVGQEEIEQMRVKSVQKRIEGVYKYDCPLFCG
jgi:hypothetical protein